MKDKKNAMNAREASTAKPSKISKDSGTDLKLGDNMHKRLKK